jgi:4-amino-4-deoxy-L-arabinose transferase-like glycosyltransferase
MRPYIGGSQNNSILELTLGYNGLGRLSGQETGSVGGGNGWGVPGLFRMFNSEFGGQIAWLLPSVLVLGTGLLWLGRRAPRTDGVRASVIVWGSWVLVTGLVFSFMAGIIHPYYAVALAPGIAGLAGLGGALLWQHRAQLVAAVALAAAVAAGGFLAFDLLGNTTAYGPWLRWAVLFGALAAAAGLLLSGRFPSRILQRTTAVLALAASLAGPLAYSISTAAVPHSGAIPSAGPTTTFGGFGAASFGGRGGFGQAGLGRNTGQTGTPPQALQQPGAQGGGFGGNRQGGGMGGLLGATTPSSEMVAALKSGASNYTWAAAVVGSNNAAGYQLATELPVMAVGGFNGTDPSPTLEQFQGLVAQGKIHYFIAGGTMQANSGSEAPAQIAQWVAANFPAQTIGGTTVYALAG